jgi:ParB-like chromosome segregation protein Spo0J
MKKPSKSNTQKRDNPAAGNGDLTAAQPISRVTWVRPDKLRANDYNPNRVFPNEMELIKISLMENGWTQPVVARGDGEIVDGFHRWTLVKIDPEVAALTGGLVPVVFLDKIDAATQRLATIRHNRARGLHGVLKMGVILQQLREAGLSKVEIMTRLQMEEEEFDRLNETRGAPDRMGKESFGLGWEPDVPLKT